jgi:hypothetical protein
MKKRKHANEMRETKEAERVHERAPSRSTSPIGSRLITRRAFSAHAPDRVLMFGCASEEVRANIHFLKGCEVENEEGFERSTESVESIGTINSELKEKLSSCLLSSEKR